MSTKRKLDIPDVMNPNLALDELAEINRRNATWLQGFAAAWEHDELGRVAELLHRLVNKVETRNQVPQPIRNGSEK